MQNHPPDVQPAHHSIQSAYSSKPPSSRVSATTIDVPLFLQPVAYDPVTAPPVPERPLSSPHESYGPEQSLPQPQRFPPPPPKIPLDHDGDVQSLQPALQLPQYDPQHSYDLGQELDISLAAIKRPQHDPQHSHDDASNAGQWQTLSQRPQIPTPQFTTFNEESALPQIHQDDQINFQGSNEGQAQSNNQNQSDDNERSHAGQQLPQSSISPVGPNDNNHFTQNPSRWEPQAAYVPSPEPQHAVLSHNDGNSLSTTDASSNRPGLSTPESQQTSNTSYRENEHQVDQSRQEQQIDGSFYWHSGRSSSASEDLPSQNGSTTATPGESSVGRESLRTTSTVQQEPQDLPVRSTSLSTTPFAPYGASALGFGGPSDWEYFGDYEAEEIDDEELYSRPKPRAELPAEPSTADLEPKYGGFESGAQDRPVLPERSPARQLKAGISQEVIIQRPDIAEEDQWGANSQSPTTQSPTTPHATSDQAMNPSERPLSDEQRPDLDEVIRAWSEAPYVGIGRKGLNNVDNDADLLKVAEASLASTPQEHQLGVDVILRDAPSLPKLPEAMDQNESLRDTSEHNSEFSMDRSKATSMFNNHEERQHEARKERKSLLADQSTKDDFGTTFRHEGGSLSSRVGENQQEKASPIEDDAIQLQQPPEILHEPSVVGESDEDNIANSLIDGPEKPGLALYEIHQQNTGVLSLDREASQEISQQELLTTSTDGSVKPSVDTDQELLKLSTPKDLPSSFEETPESILYETFEDGSSKSVTERIFASTVITPHQDTTEKISQNHSEEGFYDSRSSHAASRESLSDGFVATPKLNVAADGPRQDATITLPSKSHDQETLCQDNGDILSRTAIPSEAVKATPNNDVLQKSLENSDALKDTVPPKETKLIDPYADLDPWGKASLNRFAAMLREEARAETNKEKLNIFNVFTSRESRLRVVLYGSDDDLIVSTKASEFAKPAMEKEAEATKILGKEAAVAEKLEKEPEDTGKLETEPMASERHEGVSQAMQEPMKEPQATKKLEKGGFVKQAIERANTMSLQRSLKALPALPPNRQSMASPATGNLASLAIPENPYLKEQEIVPDQAPEGRPIVTNSSPSDGMQYSPGGRPIVQQIPKSGRESDKQSIVDSNSAVASSHNTADLRSQSPTTDPAPPLESESVIESQKPTKRPAKCNEGRSEVNNYLTNRRSIYRPYATQTLETMDIGSNFGREPDVKIDTPPFPSLPVPRSQYNPATQGKDSEDTPERPSIAKGNVPGTEQPDLRRFVDADFDPLLMVLPESEAVIQESAQLRDMKDVMEAIPEDFSFIHASVVAWDAKTKKQREVNDRQRHARQVESEQRIDSLFDDHEIGYGDISELEAGFKVKEAAKKADEDRAEYQTFVSEVFNMVWTRLHYELDQLIPHYEQYSKVMNDTLAGKEMFEDSGGKLALAPTMNAFLALHQKIEIRHQKAFEAVLERDRRLKKTEISPWYTLSNIPRVKQLEKQFEDAEKEAIIEYCEQRDARANRLMDVLDQNTLRGVGANQDYMEAIMKAVRRIASGRAYASAPASTEATAGLEEVQKAKAITTLLAASSEQIVQTFHIADMLLNSADYEVSVAKAKIAKADMATLAKLKEERAKEDQKLMRDLEHRLALIREDSRRTNDEIVKLMLFLGLHNGRADAAPPALGVRNESDGAQMPGGPAAGPAHEERIRKALEEAKKRNALKDSGA